MQDLTPEERKLAIFYEWLKAGRTDRAIRAGLEALAHRPQDARLHADLGTAYMAAGDERKAREHFRQSLAIAPEDSRTQALLALAELRRTMPRYARAEQGALDALAADPDNADAWYALAWATRGYDEAFALQCNQRVLELAPDSEWGHMQRGQFLATFGAQRVFEGLESVDRSLALAPDSADVHVAAAEFFFRWGKDRPRARDHAAAALALDPDNREARAWSHRMRLEQHWVARVLRFPQRVCGFGLEILGKWARLKVWYVTFPLALLLGSFLLWGFVLWGLTCFPLLKLFEWLLIRARELRLDPRLSWTTPVFAAPETVRWLIFSTVSATYLASLWLLWRGDEHSPMAIALQSAMPVFVLGIVAWVAWRSAWEWWRKRVLRRRLSSARGG